MCHLAHFYRQVDITLVEVLWGSGSFSPPIRARERSE
jgi:hypothetical protein